MLIMNPADAALAIGAKCGGSAPTDDDKGMMTILQYMIPRLEGIMNVSSLVRGNFVDYFYASAMPTYIERPELMLLLSNGYVDRDSVVLTAPDGETFAGSALERFQTDEGVIHLNSWARGTYSVAYTSGFAPTPIPDPVPAPVNGVPYNPELRVLQNVPDWIKGLTVTLLVMWYRTVMVPPRVSKDISYGQIDAALRRELYARVYEKYMRPRVGVTFSERMDRVA